MKDEHGNTSYREERRKLRARIARRSLISGLMPQTSPNRTQCRLLLALYVAELIALATYGWLDLSTAWAATLPVYIIFEIIRPLPVGSWGWWKKRLRKTGRKKPWDGREDRLHVALEERLAGVERQGGGS